MMKPRDRKANRAKLLLSLALALISQQPAAADPQPPVQGTQAKFVEISASVELLAKLRRGGYVLYLRHGHTDNTRSDRYPTVDLDDCSTQRPLTEKGRKIAASVGESMRKAGIPIGDISASPLCRARDTAMIAFPGAKITLDADLMYTANLTYEQKKPIIAKTKRLLSAQGPANTNRLIVAHAPNLMDLMGYFPKEATLVVFKPKAGEDFDYVASIPPKLWQDLLR